MDEEDLMTYTATHRHQLSRYFGVTFWEVPVFVFIHSPWSSHATAEADGNAVHFIV